MRILLDEDLPRRLCSLLVGHEVRTLAQCGWAGTKNGKLLELAATRCYIFLTVEQNLEFQQKLATLPIAVLVVMAVSNRIEHLRPLICMILREVDRTPEKSLRRIGG